MIKEYVVITVIIGFITHAMLSMMQTIKFYKVKMNLGTAFLVLKKIFLFGFRKNLSTAHAIINLIENVQSAKCIKCICTKCTNVQSACGIFIDRKKAFDTVDHNILLRKLFME